jgi:peptide-methionine (R)-S-oxide reductase
MKTQLPVGLVLGVCLWLGACDRGARATDPSTRPAAAAATTSPYKNVERTDKVNKSKEEWKKQLTAEQFRILREKGTEPPFDNKYWNNHDKGIYKCAGCGLELFSSAT